MGNFTSLILQIKEDERKIVKKNNQAAHQNEYTNI